MSEDCPHCVFEKTEANCRGCFEGSHYRPKPITNANRIRSMTDEELAWELCRIVRMPFYKDDSEIDAYEVDCWAKWLKREAEI